MIKINLNKAKDIVHAVRRHVRSQEFAPYDEIIMKQIPGNESDAAEAERVKIRGKYSQIQEQIDACSDENELKTILQNL